MRINLLIITFLVLTVTTSCNKNKKQTEVAEVAEVEKTIESKTNEYNILGNIKNIPDSTWIYIDVDNKIIDSTQIVQEKFQFKGSLEEPTYFFMIVGNHHREFFSFWAENQEITINGEHGNLAKAKIEAGKTQKENEILIQRTDSLENAFTEVINQLKKSDTVRIPLEEFNALVKQEKSILAAINQKNKEFIQEHPDSYLSPDLLEALNTTFDKKTVDTLYQGLSDKMKQTKHGKEIAHFLSLPDTPKIGEQYIDFELPNTKGELVKISDIKAKYILVEFWASWCIPCIKENPKLVETYNRHKKEGFEIIGVSLDIIKRDWLRAIEKGKLPWTNVSQLKGYESDIALVYGVNAIPDNLIIDQNGKIIAKGLRGDLLEKKLKELFK